MSNFTLDSIFEIDYSVRILGQVDAALCVYVCVLWSGEH